MSWFTAVTGKAEDFLNRLDKSAADVLQEEQGQQPPPIAEQLVAQPQLVNLSPSQSVPARLHDFNKDQSIKPIPTTSSTATSSTNSNSGKSVKKKDSDEALFDFLNSKDLGEEQKRKRTPISSRHHSRQSSTSSVKSSKGKTDSVTVVSNEATQPAVSQAKTTDAVVKTEDEESRQDSPTNSHASADMDILADAMKESPTGSDQSVPESDHGNGTQEDQKERQLSSLELENRLLRNEVASLNQEMATVIKRAKDSETELSRMKDRMSEQTNSASMNDQLVRELQSRETDLTEALRAKDSQLAVLRVRLDEADKRCVAKEKTLEEVKVERERILKDHSDSSGMHSQALDSLKDKLEEVEAALKREQEAYRHLQQESQDRQTRLEQEQKSMAESLRASEKKYTEEKNKNSELGSQAKTAKASADAARRELSDYKEKAARILQSKERLISSLQEGKSLTDEGSGVSSLEFESLRQERDMLREELQQSRLTLDNLRTEIQDVETQLQQETDSSQDTIQSLEGSLKEEKRKREEAEQELLSTKQELQYMMEELHKQKSTFQARLNDREADIEKLRNQLMTKSMSSSSENELEGRVRSLTESLIQKQTMLEALGTEKNSLVLQLERVEQQYRDLENATPRPTTGTQFIAVNDHEDDVRQRLPLFLREGPADHEVTRRMKRAANSIDTFSIRLGIFLRRYPVARVFVIVYMALLHVWVLIVMMTYQPEIHGTDYQPKPPENL